MRELVGRAGDDLKMWQLYDMEALPHYVNKTVALIGDAAHPFQPCTFISVLSLVGLALINCRSGSRRRDGD